MKQLLVAILCLTFLISCKTEKKKEEANSVVEQEQTEDNLDGVLMLNGNFIYHENAAVLQTKAEIYGVITDSMMMVLNDQTQAFKKEPTDMVPVSVKAKLSDKRDKTEWKNKIEILEIIKVSEPKPDDNQVIKLQ